MPRSREGFREAQDGDVGLMREVHHGGKRPGDTNLFSFSTAIGKGAPKAPNITNTPLAPLLSSPREVEDGDSSRRRAA